MRIIILIVYPYLYYDVPVLMRNNEIAVLMTAVFLKSVSYGSLQARAHLNIVLHYDVI